MLAFYCAAIVAGSILGGALPLAVVLTHTRLQLYLSFAAGAMLGTAFFHMLPESVALGGPETLRWAALGLLGLFFLERFFSYHRHEPAEIDDLEHHDHDHGSISWGAAAFGLALHTFLGGVALASAATLPGGRGPHWGPAAGVFLATFIHKPADALTIVTLVVRSGASRRLAHVVNLAFSMMVPLGVVAFLVGKSWLDPGSSGPFTAATLSFSSGTFLCIALSDLMPELHFHTHDRVKLSVALLLGFGCMILATLGG